MDEQQAEIQQIPIAEGGDSPAAYANVCNITATPDEVFLHFGQKNTDNPGGAAHVAKVCLSLAHTKRLVTALARVIETYESTFGEVIADPAERLTPELRKRLGLPEKGSTSE